MIFTVTLNPAIDKTVVIPCFSPGKVNRIESLRVDAGGKGINVSKCLSALGTESLAATLLGGYSGERLRQMLSEQGIEILHISIDGETRTNTKIIDPVSRSNTDVNEPGPLVDAHILSKLKESISGRIKSGDIVIMSGSLPSGADASTYRDWCEYFQSRGASVIIDSDGDAMKEAIKACPCFIKPNREELSRLVGKSLSGLNEFVQAGYSLLEKGIGELMISLGSEGALFMNKESSYYAQAPSVEVKSTVGAGDAMVAAVAYGMEKGLTTKEKIRLAVAMGSASVMCEGTQAPVPETAYKLAQQIEIQRINC